MVDMVSSARTFLVVSLLAAMALLGPAAPAAATQGCETTTRTVAIGTGTLMIGESELDGVNHVDIPYPDCSAGRFYFDGGTSPAIDYQNFCASGYLRIFATAGTVNVPAKVVWMEKDDETRCSQHPVAEPFGDPVSSGQPDPTGPVPSLLR